jgi:hypothetical protein
VIHELEEVDDVEVWRAEIRGQARADKLKVRTGVNDRTRPYIARPDRPEWHAEVGRYRDLLSRTVPPAGRTAYEPSRALRNADEMIWTCGRALLSAMGTPPRT